MTIVRQIPAINRNNAPDMRCTKVSNRNDLKNLQLIPDETARLKELKDVLPWSMVDNLTLREQHDVIEELESFRSRLKKGHHDGRVHDMAELGQTLDNLRCPGACCHPQGRSSTHPIPESVVQRHDMERIR